MSSKKKPDHASRSHAILSPSGSKRWINCPPSAILESLEKTPSTSFAALEGTTAHEVAELYLKLKLSLINEDYVNEALDELRSKAHKNRYSDVMIGYAKGYADYIEEQIMLYLGALDLSQVALEIEADSPLEAITGEEGAKGSVDFRATYDSKMLVVDYKYGRGIKVEAKENPQLRIYGLSSLITDNGKEVKELKLCIYQPRIHNISEEEIKTTKLNSWYISEVLPAAEKALKGKGLQKAGSWCKFCRLEGKCATLASFSTKEAFAELDTSKLKRAQMVEIHNKISIAKSFFDALDKQILSDMLSGEKYPGLKVVESRTKRKWKDEEQVAFLLEMNGVHPDNLYNKKLKSIDAIENQLGKGYFNQTLAMLTEKPKGGPTLASEDDKRKEYDEAENDFESI